MNAVSFSKATRKQAKLRLGITGPSGAGKTYTALEIATGIGGVIAVVDTESDSASLYADRFDFLSMNLEPPYSADKFIAAITAAEDAGVTTLILDSITHEWSGEGGILDKKNRIDQRGGNSFTNWGQVTPDHDRFISKLLNAKVHIIATMRSKAEYVIEANERGKSAPKKVGMAPVQRDGTEYEFTTVFDLAITHDATVSKDRTGLFDGQIFKPSRKTGQQLMTWLNSGAAPKPAPPSAENQPPPPAGPDTRATAASPSETLWMPKNPEAETGNGLPDSEFGVIVEYIAAAKTHARLDGVWKKAQVKLNELGTPQQLEVATAYYDMRKEEVN